MAACIHYSANKSELNIKKPTLNRPAYPRTQKPLEVQAISLQSRMGLSKHTAQRVGSWIALQVAVGGENIDAQVLYNLLRFLSLSETQMSSLCLILLDCKEKGIYNGGSL